jgi:hypothetical protein
MVNIAYKQVQDVQEAIYPLRKQLPAAAAAGGDALVTAHRAIAAALAPLGAAVTAGAPDAAALASMPPRSLVVFYASGDSVLVVAALPDDAVDDTMRAALEAAHGKHYVIGDDVSDVLWLAFARIQLALGVSDFDAIDVDQREFRPARLLDDAAAGALAGRWTDYAREPVSLDHRFTRFYSMTAGE